MKTPRWLLPVLVLLFAAPAPAQELIRGVVSPEVARQHGLERSWFTQVRLNPARSRLQHLVTHVSATEAHTVYEVVYGEQKERFSERDLNAYREPIGAAEAQKRAEARVAELSLQEVDAEVRQVVTPEITLYAVSDSGTIHAINGETGATRWVNTVAWPGRPTLSPAADDRYLAIVNGSALNVFRTSDGNRVWSHDTTGVPGAGAVIAGDYVFLPMLSGTIEGHNLKNPKATPLIYMSHERLLVQPTVAANSIAWPTAKGHVNVGRVGRGGVRFRLESSEPIVAPVTFLAPKQLFFATSTGYVYSFDEDTGSLLWRLIIGEAMHLSPYPVGDKVFVITDESGLFVVSARNGKILWRLPDIRNFVAASNEKVYLADYFGRLLIVDASSGAQLGALPTQLLDFRFPNLATDRIYLGTSRGIIQCLRERDLDWPIIHSGATEAAAVAAPAPAAAGENVNPFAAPAGGAAPAANPADVDPFKGDRPADPFK